jgi:MoCo/4Fe-4S cofactor protein with predicted Tat translocation signal
MDDSRNQMKTPDASYWRSLRELHGEESVSEARAHEFMSGVTDDFNPAELSTMSRKQFLALLTASAAFAAAGCTGYRDKGEIVPYTRKPEEITPGVANLYASTCTGCTNACGILIKTREGRPIKIDGNPDHPVNQGALCARGQASILNLYDPNRLRAPMRGSSSSKPGNLSWKQADDELRTRLDECTSGGKQIAILARPTTSPTSRKLLKEFAARYPTTRLYTYELFNEGTRRSAWAKCYGNNDLPVIAWEKAKVIVTLEADILGNEGQFVEQIRKYAAGRDAMKGNTFNRLYAVEGSVTLTGTNADYRLRLRPDAQGDLIMGILNEICLVRGEARLDPELVSPASSVSLQSLAKSRGVPLANLTVLVDDLIANRGQAIVYAGNTLPEAVHVAVNYLNELLGNTVLYDESHTAVDSGPLSSPEELGNLTRAMGNGQVGMVLHLGTNPVYHLPATLGYKDALKAVPTSVCFTEAEDETAQWCTHVLPVNHAFESWGDHSIRTGLTSLQQPVIAPLYATRQTEAILLTWMSKEGEYRETIYHDYLMRRWEAEVFPKFKTLSEFKSFWLSALHDGVTVDRGSARSAFKWSSASLQGFTNGGSPPELMVGLKENFYIGDGRFANNGWLQELPHPVSKIVWDNYVAVSPKTAGELGVHSNDLLAVTVGGARAVIPVLVQPGHADRYLSVELGYGRTNAGPIGSGIGTDVTALLSKDALTGARIAPVTRAERVEGSYELVSTQEHHAMDTSPLDLKDIAQKREIVREGTLQQYQENPDFLWEEHKRPELFSIATEVQYNGVKWAMAIDLNKCVGCNVCVSGCNVENNIPVVGKDQVQRGREMQWIRLDRYYAGSPEDPSFSHQPMLCQHCDQAPCENVCPVVATNHSPDGLNQMVYNRCVGTKYCSNNCPYKVRRFNFYNFRDHLADGYYLQEPLSLMYNPEVTVRSRGVMEKCTFCVQRITEARQHAAEQGRPLRGSDVRTACQEACPAQAIVFGDMNDPESAIAHYRKHSLGYHVLEDLNVKPNVTYVAKLKNTDTEKVS